MISYNSLIWITSVNKVWIISGKNYIIPLIPLVSQYFNTFYFKCRSRLYHHPYGMCGTSKYGISP
nr:MAG TPA: hypothetical protein [Siphoviridae sp. ctngg6]DAN23170.1 MAG TPA_asm: hypothetical protein [Bacteriophage sp.]